MCQIPVAKGFLAVDHGWVILVDKPSGWTSNQIVSKIKKITGIRKIGHAGSLDPMATGLLVLALGKATKLLGKGLHGAKTYLAVARIAAASSTWDCDSQRKVIFLPPPFGQEEIEHALTGIRSCEYQVPPMVSALKRKGRTLYSLFHKGYWLEREPRPAVIDRLDLEEYNEEQGVVKMTVAGGGGLYIRSIVNDLGKYLGIPVIMEELRRTTVGNYHIEDALKLAEIEEAWSSIE